MFRKKKMKIMIATHTYFLHINNNHRLCMGKKDNRIIQ
ncbi:hypothetical protein Patl1_21639 [Pistacia atlantica]|uniref:Uncharacterized protein n=1 Tax=Pistacia atlantica TaxID=434234 RepID=A0ACC1BKC8_9ROSI|nr:hypothetical protein Patl1_21639 [Pistacia atlantica]